MYYFQCWAMAAAAVTTFSSAAYALDTSANTNMVVYWGQGPSQERLSHYCEDSAIDIIPLAFLNVFPDQLNGGYPGTNFGNQCGAETYKNLDQSASPLLSDCPNIGPDIKTCQAAGKKILLSLGGGVPTNQSIKDDASAVKFANFLWNAFGPKRDSYNGPRPFGDAIVDGFDFDIETVLTAGEDPADLSRGYGTLIHTLRALYATEGSKKFYISGAPQCVVPDAHLAPAIASSWFDFVFVQFYNTPQCSARAFFNHTYGAYGGQPTDISFDAWASFLASSSFNPTVKLYLGLPAAPTAAYDPVMYLNPSEAKTIIEYFQARYPNAFGGIMLFDATRSETNSIDGKPYSDVLKTFLLDSDYARKPGTQTTTVALNSTTPYGHSTTYLPSSSTTSPYPSIHGEQNASAKPYGGLTGLSSATLSTVQTTSSHYSSSAGSAPYHSTRAVPYSSGKPIPYASGGPVLYASSGPVPYATGKSVPNSSSGKTVPYASGTHFPYGSSGQVPRASGKPFLYSSSVSVLYASTGLFSYKSSGSVLHASGKPVPYALTTPVTYSARVPISYSSGSGPVHYSSEGAPAVYSTSASSSISLSPSSAQHVDYNATSKLRTSSILVSSVTKSPYIPVSSTIRLSPYKGTPARAYEYSSLATSELYVPASSSIPGGYGSVTYSTPGIDESATSSAPKVYESATSSTAKVNLSTTSSVPGVYGFAAPSTYETSESATLSIPKVYESAAPSVSVVYGSATSSPRGVYESASSSALAYGNSTGHQYGPIRLPSISSSATSSQFPTTREVVTTVLTSSYVTTCPATKTLTLSGIRAIHTTLSVSTVYVTYTSTICTKCIAPSTRVPVKPTATSSPAVIEDIITTVVVRTSSITSPVTKTVTYGTKEAIQVSQTVSTIYETVTSTICTKCVAPPTFTPSASARPTTAQELVTTIIVSTSVTTCPVTKTVAIGISSRLEVTQSILTVYETITSTLCTKCTGPPNGTLGAPPAETGHSRPASVSPAVIQTSTLAGIHYIPDTTSVAAVNLYRSATIAGTVTKTLLPVPEYTPSAASQPIVSIYGSVPLSNVPYPTSGNSTAPGSTGTSVSGGAPAGTISVTPVAYTASASKMAMGLMSGVILASMVTALFT